MKKNNLPFVLFMALSAIVSAQAPTTFGIGIDNPNGTLHIHSSVLNEIEEPPLPPENRDRELPGYYETILHLSNTATGTTSFDGFVIDQYDGLVSIHQYEDKDLHVFNYTGVGFTLTPGGYFGIGTTTPSTRLEVNGNTKLLGALSVTNRALFCTNGQPMCIGMAHVPALDYGSTYIGFNAERMSENSWTCHSNTWLNGAAVIWSTMNGDLLFSTLPSTGATDQTGVTDNYVRSHVNMKLGADGVLMAKEVKVTLTGWPDYVFGEEYSLMSLPETEAYIRQNGHLPNVPSAAEVETEGVSLGEMNKALMQKVEELTLHVIELQKQIDELKTTSKE